MVATLTLLAGCGADGPSRSERSAGQRWLAAHGSAWRAQEARWRDGAQRIMGGAGLDPAGPSLPDWCRKAPPPRRDAGPPPFPVAGVQQDRAAAADRLSMALEACSRSYLSHARMLAHQVVDRLSDVDRLLERYQPGER